MHVMFSFLSFAVFVCTLCIGLLVTFKISITKARKQSILHLNMKCDRLKVMKIKPHPIQVGPG